MQGLTFLALVIMVVMYYFKRNYALDLENKLKRVEAIDKLKGYALISYSNK